jgi:predicted restriction endonuclease
MRIQLSDGSYYAEAHHVRPLGRPYNGPDTIDNIICVCPNCHVLLDYKVIKLEKPKLPNVSSEYVDFHNREIYGR